MSLYSLPKHIARLSHCAKSDSTGGSTLRQRRAVVQACLKVTGMRVVARQCKPGRHYIPSTSWTATWYSKIWTHAMYTHVASAANTRLPATLVPSGERCWRRIIMQLHPPGESTMAPAGQHSSPDFGRSSKSDATCPWASRPCGHDVACCLATARQISTLN